MANVEYNDQEFLMNDLVVDKKNRFFNGKISEDIAFSIIFSTELANKCIDKIFITNDSTYYTLFNCRFKIYNNDLTIYYDSLVIGAKLNNFLDENCFEISLSFNHTAYNIVDIEDSIGKEIMFNYKNEEYKIYLNFHPRKYILKISSSDKISVKIMISKLLEFYSFISFLIGQYYVIDTIEINIFTLDKKLFYYPYLNSKYNVKKKDSFTNQVLFNLKDVNVSNLFKNWKSLRKKTHAIFDLYLVALAEFQFDDISLSFMINILEGYSKVLHNNELYKLKKYNKDSKKKGIDLRVILEYFYLNNYYSNLIFLLSPYDKNKMITKLVNHRNYFDHLNEKKNRYYGRDCSVMFAKLNLIFRIIFLKDLKVNLDINKIKKNIEKINNFYYISS